MSADSNCQVPGVQFLLSLLPPLGLDWVAAVLCSSRWWVQVALVCPRLTLKQCVDQKLVGSQSGLMADQVTGNNCLLYLLMELMED